jgi:hypothetical protein
MQHFLVGYHQDTPTLWPSEHGWAVTGVHLQRANDVNGSQVD